VAMHLTPLPKGAMTGFKVGSLAALGDKFPSTGNSITFEDGHGVLQLSNGQTVKVRARVECSVRVSRVGAASLMWKGKTCRWCTSRTGPD
jgi:hypothetical protein